MKLSEIKATKDNPVYVNLSNPNNPQAYNGFEFKNSLKWDGRWLYKLIYDAENYVIWEIKDIPLDQAFSDQWSIDENALMKMH